jgi:uncharacterized protein (TIGR04222 family)
VGEALGRLAAWSADHGGSWIGSALDLGSIYAFHLLFVAAVLLSTLLLRRLHRLAVDAPAADPRHLAAGGRSNSPHALLFPYEAAFLAGGPERVAEAALAALAQDGWIESTPSGRLSLGPRDDLVRASDPVAISVLAMVAGQPPAAAREVRRRAGRLREILDVSGILYARRLLVSESTRNRLRFLRWLVAGLAAVAGAVLLLATASRAPGLRSPPVLAAAAVTLVGVLVPPLAGRRPLFRTALGEAELFALCGAVCDKAHWVAGRVWSNETEAQEGKPWADVDRIVAALQRPPTGRPPQLGELWGREDEAMAIALRGRRGIPDRGLRRGLDDGGRSARRGPSTSLSTPVHNMMRPGDI